MPWERTDQFIRSGHRSPDDFKEGSLRTITIDADRGIKAVVGKLKGDDSMTVQSYLFSRKKGWTLEKAKAWFREHHSGEVIVTSQDVYPSAARFRNYQSFSWLESVLPLPYPNTLKIVALTVGKTRNDSVYVEEEMQRAARTMVEKPVFYGKTHNPEDKRVIGNIVWAEFEDSRLECVAVVEPEIYDLVKSGKVRKCSVETRYIYPEQVDGVKVHGLLFDGLLLVPNDVEVGDTQTSVTVLNRMYETISSQTQSRQDSGGSQTEVTQKNIQNIGEAAWDTVFINRLPDSAFTLILPGGKKDEDGKTVPRSLRKLPHHKPDGSVDLPHLRNALARLPQADMPADLKEKARRHLIAHAKELGVGDYETVTKLLAGIEKTEQMGKEGDNPPASQNAGTGGQSGSTPHFGEGDVLTKQQVEEIIDKRLQTLTETLQSLQKSLEDFKEQSDPDVLVDKTREILAKELGSETKPQGKGIVSDEGDLHEISEFSDLLRPNPGGNTGGQ